MSNQYDVIVIGAGIVGVSTAMHLQKKGHSVLLMDKKGIAQETSYGNSGVLDTGYVLPFAPPSLKKIPQILLGMDSSARITLPDGLIYTRWIFDYYLNSGRQKRQQNGMHMRPLVEGAVEEHKELLHGTEGLKYLLPHGRAKLYRDEKSFRAAQLELDLLMACGVETEVFDVRTFHEIEPNLKPNYYRAVTCRGSGRYINPQKAIELMAQKFVEQGGFVKTQEVSNIQKRNEEWLVNHKHKARHIVVCTGPWANELLKPLGHKFPIAMKRGYHKHYKSSAKLSHALVDVTPGYLICPMEQGIRITTGVEFAELYTSPNPVQIEQVMPRVQELIDMEGEAQEGAWLGSRPCMVDSLPVIGESKRHKGLWFNFGHGHVGLTAGPASGKLLAQMLSHEKLFCDPKPYDYQRF